MSDQRLYLLRSCAKRIDDVYLQALAEGVEMPVVLVLNGQDAAARNWADCVRGHLPSEPVSAQPPVEKPPPLVAALPQSRVLSGLLSAAGSEAEQSRIERNLIGICRIGRIPIVMIYADATFFTSQGLPD